jgi:hypothetical protein
MRAVAPLGRPRLPALDHEPMPAGSSNAKPGQVGEQPPWSDMRESDIDQVLKHLIGDLTVPDHHLPSIVNEPWGVDLLDPRVRDEFERRRKAYSAWRPVECRECGDWFTRSRANGIRCSACIAGKNKP